MLFFLDRNVWHDLEPWLNVFSKVNANLFFCRHPGIYHCVIIAWQSHTTYYSVTPLASLWAFLGSKYWNSLYLNIHHLCSNEFLFACKPSSAFPNGRTQSVFGPELAANAIEAHIISQANELAMVSSVYLDLPAPSPSRTKEQLPKMRSSLQFSVMICETNRSEYKQN